MKITKKMKKRERRNAFTQMCIDKGGLVVIDGTDYVKMGVPHKHYGLSYTLVRVSY